MASNHTATNQADANKQLAENTLASINDASTAGRALYTGFMVLTAYIIVALGTTDDLQLFDRAPLTLPLLNVEISLTGFYRYAPWLYVIVHANLLLVFSMIAEKHRYFAELVDRCGWPDRVHMRQQLHVNAFTQFLGADHSGLLAVILMLMIWFTIGLLPPLLLLAIQLDFLAAQIESVTRLQQAAVFIDGFLVCFFWNNILQKVRGARFPKDWSLPLSRRYPLNGIVLLVSVLLIVVFSLFVALVPLSDFERLVHDELMPEWLGLAKNDCVLDENLENDFNRQLVDASNEAREWKTPYRCSNWLTWWFIDRSDSWLNDKLEVRRWLNLPDKVLVENRKTVSPEWLNRLKSEWAVNINDTKTSKSSPDKNTSKSTDTVSSPRFNILENFLPVNKEKQNFHFARFHRSFLPNAKMKGTALQGADLSRAQLQGADLSRSQLQGAGLRWAQLQDADLQWAQLQSADLQWAQLQGANLQWAQLQGANLSEAHLQSANLKYSQLQVMNLWRTKLYGASLLEANLQGVNLSAVQLQGTDLKHAQLQGSDLWKTQLQGADLSEAQLQGAVLLFPYLRGVQFSRANLDFVLMLNPIVDWEESDNNLLTRLNRDRSPAVNENLKKMLLVAIERMKNAKIKSLPNISKAKLEKQDHRCLLLTNNRDLRMSARHVCDSVSDPSINPLIHLRKWAKYNSLSSCNHKRFSTFSTRLFDIDIEYNIVSNYRTQGNKDTTPDETSEALYNLASFLLHKQLIQIHQDKTILCEGRKELNAWYKEIGYENDSKEKSRILDLKLEPFPTSTKH